MLSFKEFITEVKTTNHPFPDKISIALTPDEMKSHRNKIASIGMGIRDYNRYIKIKGEMPPDTHSDSHIKAVAKALDVVFDKKRDISVDGEQTFYHATRHNVKFDDHGLTTVRALVSTAPQLKNVMTYLKKQYPGEDTTSVEKHHILEIKHSGSDSNVPAVYIGHHSTRSREKEIIFPPFTTFRHIESRDGGIHPETGKQIMVHTVEPVFTHPRYDRKFSSLSQEEKIKQFSHIKPMVQLELKKKKGEK